LVGTRAHQPWPSAPPNQRATGPGPASGQRPGTAPGPRREHGMGVAVCRERVGLLPSAGQTRMN